MQTNRPKVYKNITMFNDDMPEDESERSDLDGPYSTEVKSRRSSFDEKMYSFGKLGTTFNENSASFLVQNEGI